MKILQRLPRNSETGKTPKELFNDISNVRYLSLLERFSIECRKTQTKVITPTNRKNLKQHKGPIRIRSKSVHETGGKRGKARASKSRLVLALLLIG